MNFEPDRKLYPLRGIDVSHHQGKIDWQAVSKDDVQFVYIKSSEGKNFKDSKFAENWKGTAAAGLQRGAYHYYSLCADGKEQAENFISTVPVESDALPPAIDLEFGGNCKNIPDDETVFRNLREFIALVEGHYKQKAIFYVTREFYERYLINNKSFAEKLWVRRIVFEPSAETDWVIWQYHNRGHVKGISTPVDLNVRRRN